ncbi:MAPEG family protein [Aestuariirhabdus sp. Z084]|uniref:MAPEG family protein n=1 Tax=Aestuariirhabdus haliotis TaxID=2918751 RepID=UPI00201B42E7|nr:MAPEG family protein [Aestuariirhabdus haliotis]MCL6417629.1 MAPEG family protein [Aestuariirhabdus haliotis]MCL6421555.1 MAPEG family protein [Aestuariirhabdus haliotis]
MQAFQPILLPVVTLIAWTLVMWVWMYATRLPAMHKAGMTPDSHAPRGAQMAQLPPPVQWKADNYTHLMEQPTIFYALALVLALIEQGSGANLVLAWSYVVLRVVHSLVQALVNKIEVRFGLFVLSTLALFGLAVNALLVLL